MNLHSVAWNLLELRVDQQIYKCIYPAKNSNSKNYLSIYIFFKGLGNSNKQLKIYNSQLEFVMEDFLCQSLG